MNNPYNAPGADLSQPLEKTGTYVPAFFSLSGRLGRVRYVAYLMGVTLLVMLAGIPISFMFMTLLRNSPLQDFLPLLLSVAVIGVSLIVAIRRLNDMDKSGWLSLLALVPIVNLFFGLWLLFGQGDEGTNKYGPPPCKNSTGVIAACVAAVVGVTVVVILTLAFAPHPH